MTRHSSFVPLSREHHDGLSLAIRLQQGSRASLTMWSHDLRWQAEHTVNFFDEHLVRHFRIEEDVLFPVAGTYIKDHPELADRLVNEHRQLEALAELLRHPISRMLPAKLKEFGKLLEGHIRAEERELFPCCESSIPQDTLAELGRKIRHYPSQGV
jgi:hemerythrin-like domain-containing protein